MTGENFEILVLSTGLSTGDIALALDVHVTTVNRWRSGDSSAPKSVVLVLRSLVDGITVAEVLRAERIK